MILIAYKKLIDFPRAMSTHEIGLKDLVEALSLLETVPRMYLFVVCVVDIYELHIGLSEPVSEVMNELKRQVLELAQVVLSEKSIHEKIH